MRELIRYAIFSLQSAAIYAIAASGIVVTYTTSGVFNFAHGAIGMLAAFAYWELRFHHHVPALISLVIVLGVFGPLAGIIIDRIIMRGLATASTITKIVVSVGLLFAFIQAGALIWPQDKSYVTKRFFEGRTVTIDDVTIPYHSLIVMGLAVAVAIGLWLVLNHTRLGIGMRAVVDDRELSQLNGVRPDRTSSVSWALGCSLAALAGVCISPIIQLDVVLLTLLVVNAYAAAMVGRLRSLPLTFLGALILGAVENYSAYAVSKWPDQTHWLDQLITSGVLPIVVLFVVLIAIPQPRAALATMRARSVIPMPSLRQTLLGGAALVAGAAVAASILPEDRLIIVGKGLALALVMLSLVPLVGYAGQLSLAQLAFAGIGALVAWEVGQGSVAGYVLAVVVTAAVGALVALPTLRLKGLYLALITMAFALLVEKRVLGGVDAFTSGNGQVARLKRLPGFEGDRANFVLLALVFALVAVLIAALRRGHFGRRLQAMKDSPAACTTLGLDLTTTRLQVFAFAAGIAGLGGALLAGWKGDLGVSDADFSLLNGPLAGLPLLLLAVVGGITSVAGVLIGGLLLTSLPMLGDDIPSARNFLLLLPGLVGISLARNPDGIASEVSGAYRRLRAGRSGSRPTAAGEREGQGAPGSPPFAAGDTVVPEELGLDHPISVEELAELDDVTGLSWGRCPTANGSGGGSDPDRSGGATVGSGAAR